MMFDLKENRYTYGIYVVLMSVLAMVAFGNLRTHHFLDGWDDWDMMADMRVIAQDPSMLFSASRIYDVRPPADLVFLSGYFIWGENPAAYHMLQIVLHLFASLLAVYVFRRLGAHLELSLLGGLLFLINAAHFRAVHWIICIQYVLALLFSLILILCFVRFLENRKYVWLLGAFVALSVAMLSHPSSASSALFCVYLAWRKVGSFRQACLLSLPLVFAVPVLGAVAHFISPENALESEGLFSTPDVGRLLTNLLWYPGRLVSSAYWLVRTTTSNTQPLWELGLGALVLAGVGVLYRRGIFPVADWAVWVVVSVLPFVNNRVDRLAFGPSRQLYLASLGASLVLAWGIYTLANRFAMPFRRWVLVGLTVVLAVSGIWSLKRAEALAFYFGARGYAFRNETDREKGRFAIQLFERAQNHAPGLIPEDVYIRMGTLGLTFGGFPMQVFQDALEKDPSALDIRLLLGIAEFMDVETRAVGEDRVQQAFGQATEKATFRTLAALGYLNLGVYYNESGHPDEAIALYRKSLFWEPGYVQALTNLGEALDKKGQSEEAIAFLAQAVAQNPDDGDVLNNLASALYNAKRYKEALEIYQVLAKRFSNRAATHFRLGQMWSAIENNEAASQAFEQAVLLDPKFVEAWQNLGNAYFQVGKFAEATRAYRRLAKLDAQNVSVLNNLGYLLYRQDQLEEAIRFLKEAEGVSYNGGTLLRLGMVYEKQERFKDALEAYRKILRKEPDNVEAKKRAVILAQKHFPEMLKVTGKDD